MYSTTKIKLPRSNTFRLQKVFYRLQHIYRKHLIQKENFQTGIITAQFVALIQVQLPGADLLWQSTSQIKAWFQYTGKKKRKKPMACCLQEKMKMRELLFVVSGQNGSFLCIFVFVAGSGAKYIAEKTNAFINRRGPRKRREKRRRCN